ncbi:hypothetical protein [Synechococcus sp. CS-205]|uniref:hypothetical protein n=1 Tax=Synechococcus sp. CS-205 TaxID=2847984 RepID=UPI00223BD96E|nr:hypothetical protein [Synechococcus sp. CS-205]MCT0247869.1 hypothetical protein [Synechococcus sp. CS-205]
MTVEELLEARGKQDAQKLLDQANKLNKDIRSGLLADYSTAIILMEEIQDNKYYGSELRRVEAVCHSIIFMWVECSQLYNAEAHKNGLEPLPEGGSKELHDQAKEYLNDSKSRILSGEHPPFVIFHSEWLKESVEMLLASNWRSRNRGLFAGFRAHRFFTKYLILPVLLIVGIGSGNPLLIIGAVLWAILLFITR